jgi:hypothetical protein
MKKKAIHAPPSAQADADRFGTWFYADGGRLLVRQPKSKEPSTEPKAFSASARPETSDLERWTKLPCTD